MLNIIKIITKIRESVPKATIIYGRPKGSVQFCLLLRDIFPNGVIYFNDKKAIFKYEDSYYNVLGVIPKTPTSDYKPVPHDLNDIDRILRRSKATSQPQPLLNDKSKTYIYTDGACRVNTNKRGGWAFVIKDSNGIICRSGTSKKSTNNKMELAAVLEALKYVNLYELENVVIVSDSEYAINGISKGWVNKWKKNGWKTTEGKDVKNKVLWQMIYKQSLKIKHLDFVFIKGHSGNKWNDLADKLATEESRSLGSGTVKRHNGQKVSKKELAKDKA